MAAAAGPGPWPAHLRPRCPCSSPPWLSPNLSRRRWPVPPAFPGPRRRDYSNSSGMGIKERGDTILGFFANLNMQSNEQEWVKESRRIFYLRRTNNVRNNVYNGATDLRAGNSNRQPLEDHSSPDCPYLYDIRETLPSKSIVDRHADTGLAKSSMTNQSAHAVSTVMSVVNADIKTLCIPSSSKGDISLHDCSSMEAPLPTISNTEATLGFDDKANVRDENEDRLIAEKVAPSIPANIFLTNEPKSARKALAGIYDKVLVVDSIESAKNVVQLLTTKYKNFVHACGTEVTNIDVKEETPVDHGEVICFSIYSENSGSQADFGNGKTCIWVDVLDGQRDVLMEFAPFFEDPSIKKVWHNYSFDSHVIENCRIKVDGFHADTRHLARLWNSNRKTDGGYSLEGLSNDHRVMTDVPKDLSEIGKASKKTIFGKKKIRKDGAEGKIVNVEPVEKLQREDRNMWICYSSRDSMNTLKLYESLKSKLEAKEWIFDGCPRGTMYDFYEEYLRPFGALLVKMEREGMLVDRGYLSEIEKIAVAERNLAADKFRKWASKYCPDAKYMNINSDAQILQLFFAGRENRDTPGETLPQSKTFRVPNDQSVAPEGKRTSKFRTIKLCGIVENPEVTFSSSVSLDTLKTWPGKIPTDQIYRTDDDQEHDEYSNGSELPDQDVEEVSLYGTAYEVFGGGKKGKEACHAIAALFETRSIAKLISSFIVPLQEDHISCKEGRIHCSLNINTETGRLSARTPNLQNQPALEKDRYKIRQAFVAAPGNSLVVADYGQLELRILAHLTNCKSMLDAFKAGGDFHSRTAMNMYEHIRDAVHEKKVLLEWHPQPGQEKPPVPLLKDAFGAERRKAKMLNFSIAYGKTAKGLSDDWKVVRARLRMHR
ncbi:DNA polymerase I A, chloroplastic isoform X2 [Brachypodium distachyon]|uniref:DNA-directed DNA polymerase family A palm domain-containing protein n=1 Tax=Brachypodium distachyon TaxID=15368 RepID=A0A2K2CXC1_BRADI|nr:DNA polymerase I A, chloroplastic isoform X2 [Brachypodium distachyon]PNT66683.1 hypothetical protein BRADI_3g15620v3 [Brachypodium distachyon]|eukprot:XP_024317545.1 DNA polymerase I A, chloroplastic isoform X2 [Brachypodium distachyon]